jgi:hypothetical protein
VLPADRKQGKIEAYSKSRFFTVTGAILPEASTGVEERAVEIAAFYAEHLVEHQNVRTTTDNNHSGVVLPHLPFDLVPSGVSDGDLLKLARAAKNCAGFNRLWDGDWASTYKSQSEADLALCSELAFWSGDMQQTDRLFRASGLYRPKWQNRHSKVDGTEITYGQATIMRAFAGKKDFYSPPQPIALMTQNSPPLRISSPPMSEGQLDARGQADVEGSTQTASPPKMNQADLLIKLAKQAGAEFFRDQRNSLYFAFINQRGRREVSAMATPSFGRWLTKVFHDRLGNVPKTESVKSARVYLEAHAQFGGVVHPLSLQIARSEDESIYVDLGDWRAVRVTADGWTVEDRPPILFRRYAQMAIHPEPKRGGNLNEIFDFMNLDSDAARTIFLAYLIAAQVPDVATPVLIATGEKGTAKTTFFRLVSRMVAPTITETLGKVDRIDEFNRQAAHARALFFDNLTSLPEWLSDALCRVVTGDAWTKRELYTDDDDVIHAYRRLAGINSIAGVADKADLLDRSIIIRPPFIPEHKRREEAEFWAAFENRRPYILGALLDTLSAAMREHPGVQLTEHPRMADFAGWGCATMRALGRRDEEFLEAYKENVGSQDEEAVEASPVAQAVLLLAAEVPHWEGTAAQLHSRLSSIATPNRIPIDVPSWPRDARKLGTRVTEITGTLRSHGVTAARVGKTNTGAKWVVIRDDGVGVSSHSGSVSSLSSTVSSRQNGLFSSQNHASGAKSDDSDDRMGASLVFRSQEKEEGRELSPLTQTVFAVAADGP